MASKAKTKSSAVAKPEVLPIDVSLIDDLARIRESANAHRDRCFAHASNNTFGFRYEALGKVAQDLIDLISGRGHTGVPGSQEGA